MSLWHQVCPVLCIVYCVPGIRSVMYWVLGHCVLGPYALDATSRATAVLAVASIFDTVTSQQSHRKGSEKEMLELLPGERRIPISR